MGRHDLRPAEGARAGGVRRLLSRRRTTSSTTNGFFDTGDVATIDKYGYMRITDRSKDVIKSGGEWISSIDLENLAVGHPKVAEAAVIGVAHPKWDERPLLIVQLKQGQSATREEILKYMEGKIAKWWMPDDVHSSTKSRTPRPARSRRPTLRDEVQGLRAADRGGVSLGHDALGRHAGLSRLKHG